MRQRDVPRMHKNSLTYATMRPCLLWANCCFGKTKWRWVLRQRRWRFYGFYVGENPSVLRRWWNLEKSRVEIICFGMYRIVRSRIWNFVVVRKRKCLKFTGRREIGLLFFFGSAGISDVFIYRIVLIPPDVMRLVANTNIALRRWIQIVYCYTSIKSLFDRSVHVLQTSIVHFKCMNYIHLTIILLWLKDVKGFSKI